MPVFKRFFMLYSVRLYVKDRWVTISFIASFLLIVGQFLYILKNIRPTSDQIFLHYNILFGVDLVGLWASIWYLAGLGLGILLLNTLVGCLLFLREKLLARSLAAFTVLLEIFLFVAIYLVVGLNS